MHGAGLPNVKSERWRRPNASEIADGVRPPPFAPPKS
jgi:hypothetical protein